jgi:tetratricopeptide (TPR) repeat protein
VVAREAMARGDLKHAAFHVACALSHDPTRADWLTLLDRIADQGGTQAPNLFPIKKTEASFATASARAYVDARLGRMEEAVSLLMQTIAVRPDIPYVEWLLAWRDRPGFRDALTPQLVYTVAAQAVQQFQPRDDLTEDECASLIRLVPLFELASEIHPDEPHIHFFHSFVLRKARRLDAALHVASAAYEAHPSWPTAVGLAYAHRAKGEIDAALTAYASAITIDPDNVSARNDVADLLVERGDLEEAAGQYRATLDREPNDPWAHPSYLYVKNLLEPGEGWANKLRDFAGKNPDNNRARELMTRVRRAALPYVVMLPSADGACIDLARQLLQSGSKGLVSGQTISIAASHLESPSARMAMLMQFQVRNLDISLDLRIETFPQPDPRLPLRAVEYVLWTYEGSDPKPTVTPPSEPVAGEVAAIAHTAYNLNAWRPRAQKLAREIGLDALDDLLAVMVHPPMPPDDRDAWDWVRQVQIASALTIGYIEAGWSASRRREALLSLAYGPMDWVGGAAVVALADIATQEAEVEPEVEQAFLDLLDRQPSEGAWSLLGPLLLGLARLPHPSAVTQERLRRFSKKSS